MAENPAPARALAPLARVRGTLRVPGDKSISHRGLLFGAFAEGTTRLAGLSPGGDVRSTRACLAALGVAIEDRGPEVLVHGRGWAGLHQSAARGTVELDCGNSGTSARLFLGLLAGGRGTFRLGGDASLSARPMRRVTNPLARLGARIEDRATLPLVVEGAPLHGADVATGVASAQVKSALLLAALQAAGPSTIVEPRPTRDHSERLLAAMGAPIEFQGGASPARTTEGGAGAAGAAGNTCRVGGGAARLAPLDLEVPGDPSSAAYAVALAVLLPDSAVRIEGVSLNPGRIGLLRLLQRMGADVTWTALRETPEPVGTIVARSSRLRGIAVDEADVVDAVDEIPLLAVLAACAEGPTTIRGAGELRVKESDRVAETVALLRAFGADADELPDGIALAGGSRFRGAAFDAHGDHRIAMCGVVAASAADGPSALSGGEWIGISYPGFFDDLARIAT